jgi:cell division protein FtsB
MSSWAIVALVAIVIWGIVESIRARAGIITDEDGNQKVVAPREDGRTAAELEAARRELAEIKERVKVLERIATDANSGDAREQARIAAEIEALRGLPAASKEEQGQ